MISMAVGDDDKQEFAAGLQAFATGFPAEAAHAARQRRSCWLVPPAAVVGPNGQLRVVVHPLLDAMQLKQLLQQVPAATLRNHQDPASAHDQAGSLRRGWQAFQLDRRGSPAVASPPGGPAKPCSSA